MCPEATLPNGEPLYTLADLRHAGFWILDTDLPDGCDEESSCFCVVDVEAILQREKVDYIHMHDWGVIEILTYPLAFWNRPFSPYFDLASD